MPTKSILTGLLLLLLGMSAFGQNEVPSTPAGPKTTPTGSTPLALPNLLLLPPKPTETPPTPPPKPGEAILPVLPTPGDVTLPDFEPEILETQPSPFADPQLELSRIWGIAGIRGFPAGERMAPNGVVFDPFFCLDLDFNFWLSSKHKVYLYGESRFWMQKAAPGITNEDQKIDFSKREYDFNLGAAWNYYDALEFRVFAYSNLNINRGNSLSRPFGFKDGLGLENRYYLSPMYGKLGTTEFDLARNPFIGLGYYPTKGMVDSNGDEFKPALFARGYFTLPLWSEFYYLFLDAHIISERPLILKQFNTDAGISCRPFSSCRFVEFRTGIENIWDVENSKARPLGYLSVRYLF